MIDIHAHILPGIDDGASNFAEAMRMLQTAAESGVHTIVATPHCNIHGMYENYYGKEYINLFKELSVEAARENIEIKIVPGMEVYASENILELIQDGRIITINGSRYILIEFGFKKDLALSNFVISELLALGYIPIVAHPERYPYVQKAPHLAWHWQNQGCLLQLDKGSLMGEYGKQAKNTAIYLLNHNMVSLIASDAHGANQRSADMSAVYDFLCSNFSLELAYRLMEQNPRKVIYDHEFAELKQIPV